MTENALAARLRSGKVALGMSNMYPAAGIIEGIARGWDFVWIDGQHGQFCYDTLLHAARACDVVGVPAVLRVPGHEHSALGRFADICPAGIIVPLVDTAEQARHIRDGLRFPPLGCRSYGGRRAADLGGREYYRDQELLVIAQTETLEGVTNARAIIETDGIDMLFFGPDDMKVRMGLPIHTSITESEQLQQAMRETAEAALGAGKHCACVAAEPAALSMARDMGYRMIVGGGDVIFLRTRAAEQLALLRAAADGAAV